MSFRKLLRVCALALLAVAAPAAALTFKSHADCTVPTAPMKCS